MPRTDVTAVQTLLGRNYNGSADLQQFIDTATVIVDRVVAKAAGPLFNTPLLDTEAELIERYLAAHFYCVQDPLYVSKSTAGASGSFQRAPSTDDFTSSEYGRGAVRSDPSGVLVSLGKRQVARGFYAGGGRHS